MKEDVVAEWIKRTNSIRCVCSVCQSGPVHPGCEWTPCPDPRHAKTAPRFLRWTRQHDQKVRNESNLEPVSLGYVPKYPTTTKLCHWCNSDALALISTQDLKLCVDCGHQMKWKLDEGQKPTLYEKSELTFD